ncbi:MAG: hypothetical protein OXH59_09190 [Rhodospirillaceae bacterium]|nr:hypothetical protein [Rhodospirillaceae bacterium]
MARKFAHTFFPEHLNPITDDHVTLTVQEIEQAAVREVLQTPGVKFGSWAILDGLLDNGTEFMFREPLGHAREVKVALSGLFGRFVARAYLERYFHLAFFAHLGQRNITLDGIRNIVIRKTIRGDLPDWIACESWLANLTIAEAKGSHDPSGPESALDRAWNQAQRVSVFVNSIRVTVKRIAIATRWGMLKGGPSTPWISVHDPIDEGDSPKGELAAEAYIGIVRHHIANLLDPLGHRELAGILRALTITRTDQDRSSLALRADELLDVGLLASDRIELRDIGVGHLLIGGIVTRSGPIRDVEFTPADRSVLERLDQRPVFVGVGVKLVRAAILGDIVSLRSLAENHAGTAITESFDNIGGHVVRLG